MFGPTNLKLGRELGQNEYQSLTTKNIRLQYFYRNPFFSDSQVCILSYFYQTMLGAGLLANSLHVFYFHWFCLCLFSAGFSALSYQWRPNTTLQGSDSGSPRIQVGITQTMLTDTDLLAWTPRQCVKIFQSPMWSFPSVTKCSFLSVTKCSFLSVTKVVISVSHKGVFSVIYIFSIFCQSHR